MLNISESLSQDIQSTITYFETNVYGKVADTDFNTDTSANYVDDENAFVIVATEVEDEIESLKLDKVTYTAQTNVSIAVGNSNLFTRVGFKIVQNNLMILAPLLYLNAGSDGIVNVSFPNQQINAFNITVFEENNLNMVLNAQAQNVLFSVDAINHVYNFKSNTPDNSVFIILKDGETVLPSTAKVLIEKVANPSLTNQSSAYTYQSPSTLVGETENGILVYPGYNGGVDYTQDVPQDHQLVYNIYVVGVGSQQIVLNFENTFVE